MALVVSTENLTQNLYHGNERSMLLQVCVGVVVTAGFAVFIAAAASASAAAVVVDDYYITIYSSPPKSTPVFEI